MRSYRATKRLSEIINKENTLLAKLFHKAEVLKQLDTEISSFLPSGMTGKAKVANISRSEVVIHIASAALLTRLRLSQNQIKQKINQHYMWAQIEHVTIKVRPLRPQQNLPETEKPHRSSQIAAAVNAAAINCDNDQLRESLLRLASHINSPERQ